jgi:hypothetical protein
VNLRCLLLLFALSPSVTFAKVDASRRHVVIVQGAVDAVWANYIFAVQNDANEVREAEIPVMMPTEVADFKAQEGVSEQDIVLGSGDAQKVVVKKIWQPGSQLVGFAYNAEAAYGEAELTFQVPMHLEEFIVMAPAGRYELVANGMQFTASEPFAGSLFDTIRAKDVPAGHVYKVKIRGIPEGRGRFWLAGGVLGILLLGLGLSLAWRTRPKLSHAPDTF